jgi:hypothetical protein
VYWQQEVGTYIYSCSYTVHQGSIYWKIPPPPWGGGEISADVIWGKKYEKVKRKRGENVKEKGRKGKEKEKRGSKRVK